MKQNQRIKLLEAKKKLAEKKRQADLAFQKKQEDNNKQVIDNLGSIKNKLTDLTEALQSNIKEKRSTVEIVELSNSINKFITIIESGISVDNKGLLESVVVSNLSEIKIPDVVKIGNQIKIPSDLATNKAIEKLNKDIQNANTQLLKAIKARNSQQAKDFIPIRRVVKDGNEYKFDDSQHGGGYGGGGGVSQFMDSDGVLQKALVDSLRRVKVVVDEMPSVTIDTAGLATSAKQDTGNTSVGNIDTNIGAKADSSASSDTGTFSLIALVKRLLEKSTTLNAKDFATSAKQDTGNASLSSIDGKIPSSPATTGKQDTGNASLSSIDTKLNDLSTRLSESDFDTKTGNLTETAPTTDTASSGLNGRLQRIAQRITSLIALLPASLGQKTKSGSLAVTIASDQDALPITDNSGSLTVDNNGTFATQATLQAGSATIGKLAANSGVDIGDVDVTSVSGNVTVVQSTATNLKTQAENYQGGTAVGSANPLQVTLANTGANSTAVKVDNSAVTQPVSGTVTTNETAPTTIYNGLKNVTTAGTRVALASSQAVKSVTIKAKTTNTGIIYVGDGSVASTTGYQLYAGDTVTLDIANLSTVNLDSSVNGEGVTYIGVN